MKLKKLTAVILTFILSFSNLGINFPVYAGETRSNEINKNSFNEYFWETYIKDFDKDNNDTLSDQEISNITELDMSGDSNLKNVNGIEYLTSLTKLDCSNTQIESLDTNRLSNLTSLDCSNTQIESLETGSLVRLNSLDCSNTQITTLETGSLVRLNSLDCSNTQITTLETGALGQLSSLDCSNTQIKSLDTGALGQLSSLDCSNTQIKSLDTGLLGRLSSLDCSNTQIESLDTGSLGQLSSLDCSNTQIESLDTGLLGRLTSLDCSNTSITYLNLPPNANITNLKLSPNEATVTATGKEISLDTLGTGIDASKIKVTSNGTLSGKTIIVDNMTQNVVYTYNCGQNKGSDVFMTVTLTINQGDKGNSTVTINKSLDKTYDGHPVELTSSNVTITGTSSTNVAFQWYKKNADNQWKEILSPPQDAGKYQVIASVSEDNYYNGADSQALEFEISQAANSWTTKLSIEGWTYGETAKKPTAEAKFGDATFSYSKDKDGTYSKDAPTEAGTWYVKASVADNDNYTGLEAITSFRIAQANSKVTITTEKMDKKYDKEAVSVPEVKKTGSTKAVTFTWYQKTQDGTWKELSSAPVNAGSYKVEASVEADTNYKEASAEKEFVISKAENEWIKNLSMKGWIYGEKANLPTAEAKFGEVTFSYSKDKDGTYSKDVPTEAGTWYVKASVTGNDNYTGLETTASFKIAKADSKVTITTEKMDKKYDKEAVSDPEVKKTGSTKAVTFTWYQKTQDGTWKELSSAPVNAGSYKVEASVEADNNYKKASAEKEFVISKAENEWIKDLSMKGWIYGEKANLPTAEAKFGDVVFSYSNEKNGTYRTEIPTEAGTWYVKAVVEETDNYTGLETIREFTILEAETPQDTGSSTGTDNVNSSTGTDQSGTDEEKKDSNTENDMKTGETADVFMWGTISILSALGIWTASVRRKRRK